jgi:serine/threonine protein kinase
LNQVATTDPHWYKHHDQTLAEKYALGLQVARAVADLHSIDGGDNNGNVTAVWLNAKPENILFVNGMLKITDFDESILQRWDAKKQEPCKFRLPTLTDLAEKPYQAAELSIDGGPLDEKIDINALGGILYSLLASTPPYRNDTDHLIHKKAGILLTYPENVKNETMTLALWNAAEHCMAHDPRLRPTAREVVNYLEEANKQFRLGRFSEANSQLRLGRFSA